MQTQMSATKQFTNASSSEHNNTVSAVSQPAKSTKVSAEATGTQLSHFVHFCAEISHAEGCRQPAETTASDEHELSSRRPCLFDAAQEQCRLKRNGSEQPRYLERPVEEWASRDRRKNDEVGNEELGDRLNSGERLSNKQSVRVHVGANRGQRDQRTVA